LRHGKVKDPRTPPLLNIAYNWARLSADIVNGVALPGAYVKARFRTRLAIFARRVSE
jgi:hypothetical protein